jgi:hypothetical protein
MSSPSMSGVREALELEEGTEGLIISFVLDNTKAKNRRFASW